MFRVRPKEERKRSLIASSARSRSGSDSWIPMVPTSERCGRAGPEVLASLRIWSSVALRLRERLARACACNQRRLSAARVTDTARLFIR